MPKLISGRSALVDSRGAVLQVVKSTKTTTVTQTTYQLYEDIDSLTLVTRGSNSSFFITATAHGFHNSGNIRGSIGFKIGSTLIVGKDGNPGDSWGHNIGNFGGHINRQVVTDQTYAAGTSLTFKLCGAQWDNATSNGVFVGVTWNYGSHVNIDYGHHSTFTVMEIAN